jgi:hypothetical protein
MSIDLTFEGAKKSPCRADCTLANCILVGKSLQKCLRGYGVQTYNHKFEESIRP